MDSGYGYGSLTEVPEVSGTSRECHRTHRSSGHGMEVIHNSQKFQARYTNVVPVPWVLWHGLTELTEVPGTDMNIVHNSHKFWVRGIPR